MGKAAVVRGTTVDTRNPGSGEMEEGARSNARYTGEASGRAPVGELPRIRGDHERQIRLLRRSF